MAILLVGCAKATPVPAGTTQNVTGILKQLNTPDEPGKDVVVVQTPQGEKIIPLTDKTAYSIEGRTCLLANENKLVDEGNTTLQCTVVVEGLRPNPGEKGYALAVYIKK